MARTIEISVQDRIAWQINRTEYICGNSDFIVIFDFDNEWAEFTVKTARFIHGDEKTDVVFSGNKCAVPIIRNVTSIKVGVFAGDLRTTTAANISARKSILCDDCLPAAPEDDIYNQIMAKLNEIQFGGAGGSGSGGSIARVSEVTLYADKWEGGENLYSQVVSIDGVTENSQVDITPNVAQLVIFYEKDLTFVTENEGGVVTVYAIGQKPTSDYTIQVTLTEVMA